MKRTFKYIFVAIGLFLPLSLVAQKLKPRNIIVKTAVSKYEERIRVLSIENLYDTTVAIALINELDGSKTTIKLKANEKYRGDVTLNVIKAKAVNEVEEIEILRVPSKLQVRKTAAIVKEEPKEVLVTKTKISAEQIFSDFYNYIRYVSGLSDEKRSNDSAVIAKHIDYLGLGSTDQISYVKNQKLREYVETYGDTINALRDSIPLVIKSFMESFKLTDSDVTDTCKKKMEAMLTSRIDTLESVIRPLRQIIDNTSELESKINWRIISVGIGGLFLCVFLFLWYRKTTQKQQTVVKKTMPDTNEKVDSPSLIVMGERELKTPPLKKQSLDDVLDNEAYLHIESNEFCSDSGVRTIHIKNQCVKDIYNMYADDLRNPNNPKEDGCMVLGRWVQNQDTQLYDVSLEYIVTPGDDAVFSEYELNFGGKIKLKVSDKLRRLRRETGLQYDLTCWVHSHPGLGVFFSNSDNNVHMQLKHPTHPKFLTALVVDILTPQQEMGIFTFKQDEDVNSKNDISKMYSLEEMYKWALYSERRSFDANDYYNGLHEAMSHLDACQGILLSNSAIIDMTFMASNQNGFIAFVHGYTIEKGNKVHCIIETVSKLETVANCERIGCFVVASHCSIPSIRKVVAKYLNYIHFVLVYTASDGLLTFIPVTNQDLCANDEYYGEQKLEALKIWTRRRR